MPTENYIITIERPRNCNIGLTKQYIQEAINSMKGCFSPDDERMGIECINILKQKDK